MSVKSAEIASIVNVLKQFGVNELSASAIKGIANQNGLNDKELKESLKQSGITTKNKAMTANYPLPETIHDVDGIEYLFKQLREEVEKYPNAPVYGLKNVTDAYEYLAFFSSDGKTAEQWKGMPVDEIRAEFSRLGTTHAGIAVRTFSLCKDIDALGKANLFNTNENREKYNNYLELKKNGLISDIEQCKAIFPIVFLRSKDFVDCVLQRIKSITSIKSEWTRSQMIDVYNHLMFDKGEDYIEEFDNVIIVVCPVCHKLHYFKDEKEAYSAQCCGQSLYKLCPVCGEKIPAISEYCTACNFYIPGIQVFDVYRRQCLEAIEKCNLTEAKKLLNSAEQAYPKSKELPSLKSKYNELEGKIGKSIQELEHLIRTGYYNAAQTQLNAIKVKFPNADVSAFEKDIRETTNWVNQEFAKILGGTVSEADGIARCMNIRTRIKDEKRVETWLAAHPPKPVQNVKANVDSSKKSCTLTWVDTENLYVTYTIVRNEKGNPKSIKDGVVVKENVKDKAVTDMNLKSGNAYYYTVFSIRSDVSAMASLNMPIVICEDLTMEDVNVTIRGEECRIDWKVPEGCNGIRVMRKDEGESNYNKLRDETNSYYTDRTVDRGATYYYSLKTIWQVAGKMYYSSGLEFKAAIISRPEAIQLDHTYENNTLNITWPPQKEDHDVFIISLKGETVPEFGKQYTKSECDAFGMKMGNTFKSSLGLFRQKIQQGSYAKYTIFSLYNGDAIAGSTVSISTLAGVTLDEHKTEYKNGHLFVEIQEIPASADKIAIMILTKNKTYKDGSCGKKNIYSGVEGTYESSSSEPIAYIFSAKALRERKTITISNVKENVEFSVLAYAIYNTDNGEVWSPKTCIDGMNKKKCSFSYEINWKGTWGRKSRKGATIILNNPTDTDTRVPRAKLVCKYDGLLPYSLEPASEVIILANIGEGDAFGLPIQLNDNAVLSAPTDAIINLVLENGEEKFYTVVHPKATYKIPK